MKRILIVLLRALRILFLTLIGSALITVGVALYFLARPDKIFTPSHVNLAALFAQKKMSEKGMSITWSGLKISLQSESLLKKTLLFESDHPCLIQKKSGSDNTQLRACFSEISLRAVIDLARLKIVEVGPSRILGGDIFYSPSIAAIEKKAVRTPDQAAPFQFNLPSVLQGSVIRPTRIQISKIIYQDGGKNYHGNLKLDSQQDPLEPKKLLFQIVAALNAGAHSLDAQAKLVGSIDPKQLTTVLGASVNRYSPKIPKLVVQNCHLDLGFGQGGALRGGSRATDQLAVNCPVAVDLPTLPITVSKLDFPRKVDLNFHTKTEGEFFPADLNRPFRTDTTVEVVPFSTTTFEGGGKISARYTGRISELKTSDSLQSEMNLSLRVPHFESLVKKLDRGPWEVPAPFHSMVGTVALTTAGSLKDLRATYPLQFQTRLSTDKQKLNLDGTGQVQIDLNASIPAFHAGMDLVFSDVVLVLPTLELSKPPQLIGDSRIASSNEIHQAQIKAQKKSQPSFFHYDIQVKTPPSMPIRIVTNLAKAPIPIGLDLKLNDVDALSGSVKVDAFPLELFKRDASLTHFLIDLRNPSSESLVDGGFKVVYTDYTIFITLSSTLGKPRIELRSNPPLPQDQLIATLLFGHPLDELDQSQSGSVGNTQAAIADGALGLASMYALASTPVESVNYDSRSGLISAKVKLAEGTSLNLGSSQNQISQVGIRKRLGKHWSVETDVTQGTSSALDPLSSYASSNTRGSAFLQWSSRY